MTVVGGVAELIAIRHAESTANAAFAAAQINGLTESGITGRDADVPLSPLGQLQAALLGRWLAGLPDDRLPETALCSPFLRALQTASIVLDRVRARVRGMPEIIVDPRLRDREMGRLELLTAAATQQRFPEEILRRQQAGEFEYRPPDGESLMDVAVRVREALRELDSRFSGRRVIVIAHDAVVLMLRYIIEELSPDQLGEIIAAGPVRNASVTRWTRDGGRLRLCEYNVVPPDVDALREGRFARLHRDLRPDDRELVAQPRAECGKIIRDHHHEPERHGPESHERER